MNFQDELKLARMESEIRHSVRNIMGAYGAGKQFDHSGRIEESDREISRNRKYAVGGLIAAAIISGLAWAGASYFSESSNTNDAGRITAR
jgi:hypothetical protein